MTEISAATARDIATAKRRDQILEAAVICFLEQGYHQTGVRDIAARAGVSLGNLYNHFPSKHDVLVEIARLERKDVDPFLEMLMKPSPAAKVLDKFLGAYAKYLSAPENVILSLEITSEAIRQPDIAKLFLDTRAHLIATLTTLIERGVVEGDFRSVPNAVQVSQLIVEILESSAERSVFSKTPMRKIIGSVKDFVSASLRPQ
ncbi:TetR/AcrR family transcriptional regulator [Ruegeria sp. EL01]|jgi:AcrR family transcriptional regulator|uniref:TetR/AcrR family transcriptional regulator n=1 Tax=Ruegeria sp. EL01 TaxID=2107578 RepID=UPI000EA82442|nr:TetR/AcrR family transcriptional regulator [Ruegeria sp. EL01]